jgi:hypothetical protein
MNDKRRVVVWGAPDCSRCAETSNTLLLLGWDVNERHVDPELKEQNSEIRAEVMSAIQLQGGILPVVYYPTTERAYCVDELSFFSEFRR